MENNFKRKIITDKNDNLDDLLEVYLNNLDYFKICGTDVVNMETVKSDIENIPPDIDPSNNKIIVFYHKNVPIAMINFLLGFPDSETFYIGLFLICEDIHRKGFGSTIYSEIEEEMKSLGYTRGKLGVIEENKKATSFWEKMGYKFVQNVISQIHPDKNWSINVMEKSLL